MTESLQSARLSLLAASQNQDGGWGYFPGTASWVEPTAWALAALRSAAGQGQRVRRALAWLRTMQRADGACRPQAQVDEPSWMTALFVTAHLLEGVIDPPVQAAVRWLLAVKGAEGALWRRAVARALPRVEGYNPDRYGWAWVPNTNSWVEPTAHTLVALKLYRSRASTGRVDRETLNWRIQLGEQMLLDRRCRDGGWNYGARQALGIPLPSYPETTGVAMMALQGASAVVSNGFLQAAGQWCSQATSPLGRAWLSIGLRLHGATVAAPEAKPREDTLLVALQALVENAPALAALRLGNHS